MNAYGVERAGLAIRRRTRALAALASLGVLACATPPSPGPSKATQERLGSGHVVGILDTSPPPGVAVVAYLEPLDSDGLEDSPAEAIVNTVRRGQIEQPAHIIVPGRPFFFRNHDESYHEFFTAGADAFRLEIPPGQRSERTTVRKPGPIRVFCSLHPDEVNQLHVARAAYQTAVRDGRFEFTDVRPGGYRLYVLKNGTALPPKTIQVSRGHSEHRISTGPR